MMMEPKITITSEESNVLNFTLSDTHFSLANSLRRIVLSEIPTLVFRAFPHSESKIDIHRFQSTACTQAYELPAAKQVALRQ